VARKLLGPNNRVLGQAGEASGGAGARHHHRSEPGNAKRQINNRLVSCTVAVQMNCALRTSLAFALSIPLGACGGTMAVPTAPSQAAASASILTIDGFTSLSAQGETGRLTAFVTFSDGSVQDESNLAQWSSTNPAVATISSGGMVTAVSDGRTTVTATFANVTGTRTIMVDLP
jgi:hypothetical protein